MNHKQKSRLIGVMSLLIILTVACGLVLFALKQNINLFYTPTQLNEAQMKPQQTLKIGGYVKNKSVRFSPTGESVSFIITDRTHQINIIYHGVLPNLFREGQAVVVTGKLSNPQTLVADQVLAKHDEKYVPSQLAKELRRAG